MERDEDEKIKRLDGPMGEEENFVLFYFMLFYFIFLLLLLLLLLFCFLGEEA